MYLHLEKKPSSVQVHVCSIKVHVWFIPAVLFQLTATKCRHTGMNSMQLYLHIYMSTMTAHHQFVCLLLAQTAMAVYGSTFCLTQKKGI